MSSFEISYDAEEDVLEITFEDYDENVARTIPLNDNILVFTDIGLRTLWGLTFYSYSKLLEVSETEFTLLGELTELQQRLMLSLLSREPASGFFDITYPDALIARVDAPNLRRLIRAAAV